MQNENANSSTGTRALRRNQTQTPLPAALFRNNIILRRRGSINGPTAVDVYLHST